MVISVQGCYKIHIIFIRWDWTSSSSDYYLDPVVLRLSESSLCRGYHENRLIPGSTDHTGRCAVGFFGKVYKLDKYQVGTEERLVIRRQSYVGRIVLCGLIG